MISFLQQVLDDTLRMYSKYVLPAHPVGIRIVPAELNNRNNIQNTMAEREGHIVDDYYKDKSFAMVTLFDWDRYNIPVVGKMWIGICLENMENCLRELEKDERVDVLTNTLAHEITHLHEKEFIEKYPEIISKIDKLIEKGRGRYNEIELLQIKKELIADEGAEMIIPMQRVKDIDEKYLKRYKEGQS